MVEESIHVVFDESDNGILSECFKELNLNEHFDDVSDDDLQSNDLYEDEMKNIQEPIQSLDENLCAFFAFVSLVKPKDIKEAIIEPEWIIAMQSELNEFK